jgi:Tat protein translocase TatB subunit
MFGIGMTELMVILVIGLVVIGPKKLPGLARSLGKSLAEFRRASDDMRREFLDVADAARIDPSDTTTPSTFDEVSDPSEASDPAEPSEEASPDPGATAKADESKGN